MSVRELISIFYPDPKARLEELIVDAFLKEAHTFSSEITERPIESGGTIVDHVHLKPMSLSIDGIISNTPMSIIGLAAVDSAARFIKGESNDFVAKALEKIEELFKKREPISIVTSLKNYQTMVLENLTVERGGGFFHDSLHFSCTAKQIQIAHQERIKIPEPKVSRAKLKQKRGLQETKTIPKEQAETIKNEKTLLFSLGKKLLGG